MTPPEFVSDLFVGTEGQWVFFFFSHCNSLPVFLIYTLVHLGSTRGATCCLNSQFAIGELLRRAAEFTLGGQGPLLFAWVQREHLGHPPTRIHRPHISDSTESSCNNKLPFCQTACTHNKREKGPLRHVVTQKIVLVPSQFFRLHHFKAWAAYSCCTQVFFQGPTRLFVPISPVSKPLLLLH